MRRFTRKTEEINLNLTPMMDLFVGLIPFLILSSAFLRLGGFDLQAPSAAQGPQAQVDSKDKELWLSFEVEDTKVTVTGYGKSYDQEVPGVKAEFVMADLPKLTAYVDALSSKHPKIGPSIFHASPDTKYEKAINVLNAMKSSKNVKDIVVAAGVTE